MQSSVWPLGELCKTNWRTTLFWTQKPYRLASDSWQTHQDTHSIPGTLPYTVQELSKYLLNEHLDLFLPSLMIFFSPISLRLMEVLPFTTLPKAFFFFFFKLTGPAFLCLTPIHLFINHSLKPSVPTTSPTRSLLTFLACPSSHFSFSTSTVMTH